MKRKEMGHSVSDVCIVGFQEEEEDQRTENDQETGT